MKKRVLLGMSGGIDSSVSAILLKEQGYEVIGITMELWEKENSMVNEGKCHTSSEINDAKKVCEQLEIPHYTINCKENFKKYVVDNFVNCYKCATTPNPCVECNKYFKFGVLFKKAIELECDYIATGHYAKIEYNSEYGQYVLKKADNILKDQSYFLYNIDKSILNKIIFPLEKYLNKDQIREIAKEHNLFIAEKKESQEICFIPDNNYKNFLNEYARINPEPGNIVDKKGNILGKHNGLINYTIGQRKGLGIAYNEPLYVIYLDKEKNEVIVGTEKELYKKELIIKDTNYLVPSLENKILDVEVKIRYRSKACKAKLYPIEYGNIKVIFEHEQRAITPGQSAVFYINDIVIGGGKILKYKKEG